MLRHKNIDRVCCVILALTVLVSALFVGAAASGLITEDTTIGYETRLFNQDRVHTIDIVMNDWEGFLKTATSEEYAACHLVIDGESYKNVAIRGKGNTSLSSVRAYGNNRYSFKVEFDHYQTGYSYHGLDKLSLNNLIQDNTYMKDYFAYTLMNKMGVAAPLCSFVKINVNGEYWGLYLAVEGVEDAFLRRNYGKGHGELYKPDSMSFGGGRGNGEGFDMNEMAERFGFSFGEDTPEGGRQGNQPRSGGDRFGGSAGSTMPPGFDPNQIPGSRSDNAAPPSSAPGMSGAPTAPGGFGFPQMGNAPTGGEIPEMPKDFEMPDMGRDFGGGFDSSTDVKLQYSDDNPSSYSNIFNNAKTDITAADQARLIASIKALGEGDTAVVDTDAVIRYMAVHNFLCNDDSYTGMMVHNYYLYEESGVLSMIPWDYNLAYGGFSGGSNGTSTVNTSISRLVSMGNDSDRPMAGWITANEAHMAQYLAVYRKFITTLFDSGWFEEEIDRVIAMIDPLVKDDPTAFCTYEEFVTASQTLKSFCLKRAQSVTHQLNGDDTRVDASDLDLTLMGTMNGMGGGPGGGSPGNRKRPGEREAPDADSSASANIPTDMPANRPGGDASFGGFFGGR